jgi:hypothetical protein
MRNLDRVVVLSKTVLSGQVIRNPVYRIGLGPNPGCDALFARSPPKDCSELAVDTVVLTRWGFEVTVPFICKNGGERLGEDGGA